MPASSTNRTWLAYPSSNSSMTSTDFTAPTHSGYATKSVMTAATWASGASIVMDCCEESASAIGGGYRVRAPRSPAQYVRRASAGEVADVDALGPPDPHAVLQRLVHVAEQRVPRLGVTDRVQSGLAADLEPPRHGVVAQLGDG